MAMRDEEMACPNCGADCWREDADVGVGIIYGPWGCPDCGWSESELYSYPQRQGFDQWGGYHPNQDPDRVGWRQHMDDMWSRYQVKFEPCEKESAA